MTDTGNKRQLSKNYTDGAIACSGGYCSFIGLEPNLDSVGCQVGPEAGPSDTCIILSRNERPEYRV
jgi:hypothetical protein